MYKKFDEFKRSEMVKESVSKIPYDQRMPIEQEVRLAMEDYNFPYRYHDMVIEELSEGRPNESVISITFHGVEYYERRGVHPMSHLGEIIDHLSKGMRQLPTRFINKSESEAVLHNSTVMTYYIKITNAMF